MKGAEDMKRLNKAEARQLASTIRGGVKEVEEALQRFIDGQGWIALGYSTFGGWWDDEVGVMRLGAGIYHGVVTTMLIETVGLRDGEERIARRVASTKTTIRRIADRTGITLRKPPQRRYSHIHKIGTEVPIEQYRRLKEYMTRHELTQADVLRTALEEFFENHQSRIGQAA